MVKNIVIVFFAIGWLASAQSFTFTDQAWMGNIRPSSASPETTARQYQSLSGVLNTTVGARQYQNMEGVVNE